VGLLELKTGKKNTGTIRLEVMANPSQPKVLTPTIEPKLRKQLQVEARSQVQPKPPAKPNGQVQPKSEVKPNPKVQPKPKQHANLGATPTQQSNPQPELSTTKKTGQNTDLNQPCVFHRESCCSTGRLFEPYSDWRYCKVRYK